LRSARLRSVAGTAPDHADTAGAQGGNAVRETIREDEGRHLFGADAAAYDRVRPPYPASFFSLLEDQRALYPDAHVLEVGAGSAIATRQLIAAGAAPVTVIEPDVRFRDALVSLEDAAGGALTVLNVPFEEVELAPAGFDLVVVATAFHWLDARIRVQKIARALAPGGSAALLWNVFQDLDRTDEFHLATHALLGSLPASPSGPDALPFPLDRAAREAEFVGSGGFAVTAYLETRWSLVLDPTQVIALYGGFSSIARLPGDERARLLERLGEIAEAEFGGRVVRHMTSVLYLFRRT